MKKSTTKVTIIIICLVASMLGYYSYLSNRSHKQRADANMTLVQSTLSRNLNSDYPATVKEVMKYYNDIMKCFYDEDCSEEQIEDLGYKARELYDADLLAANEETEYMSRLKNDVNEFREKKRTLTGFSVAASTSVDYYSIDDFSFARIMCGYNLVEGGISTPVRTVYLLRRDDQKKWKIYGWESAEAFQAAQAAQAETGQ